MTERERKLFHKLKSEGWFEDSGEPSLIAIFTLSDKRIYKENRTKKEIKEDSKYTGSKGGLFLCRGVALIYPDRVSVWQEKKRVKEVEISSDGRLKAEISDGSVTVMLGDEILFRSGMKQKTDYYMLAKRFEDIKTKGCDSEEKAERAAVCKKCGKPLSDNDFGEVCSSCKSKKRALKQLWQIMSGSRVFVFTSVALFFVVTGINLLSPYLSKKLVDDYIEPKNSYLVGFVIVILGIFGVNLLSKAVSIIRTRILITASNKIIIKLRDTVFEKVEKLSVSNVSRRTAGSLMHRITNDTSTIQNFLTNQFANLIEQVLLFFGVGTILFIVDPLLAIMILAPMPVVFIINWYFRKRVRKIYDIQWEKSSKAKTFLHDIFSGIRVVKAFGTEKRESERFDSLTRAEYDIQVKNERFFAIFSPIIAFLMGAGEIFLLYYSGYMHLNTPDMTLGDITMFSSYVSLIYGPLQWFGRLLRQLSNMLNSTSKVFEILDEKVDVSDNESPVVRKIDGNIEIKNVSFDYDERNEVLKNINLSVKKGEMIGIVGKSGVGKSTLINLVMRMYDVDDGEILIDGINIKDYSQESLRSQIGAVLQETFLFSGSIYDNIAYAKPTASREEIISASKLSGAHDFIIKLPDAYNTKVGERGYTLSGGERQRVTIARALLHDPRILILDEATSALDTETEKRIQDALSILIKNRTTLAIAHRLSTLRNATRLIVLAEGTIAEEGTHEELMAKGGIYYELVMAQRQMLSTKSTKEE